MIARCKEIESEMYLDVRRSRFFEEAMVLKVEVKRESHERSGRAHEAK